MNDWLIWMTCLLIAAVGFAILAKILKRDTNDKDEDYE